MLSGKRFGSGWNCDHAYCMCMCRKGLNGQPITWQEAQDTGASAENILSVAGNILLVWEGREKADLDSNNHSLQPWWIEKYLRVNNTSTLEAATPKSNLRFRFSHSGGESSAVHMRTLGFRVFTSRSRDDFSLKWNETIVSGILNSIKQNAWCKHIFECKTLSCPGFPIFLKLLRFISTTARWCKWHLSSIELFMVSLFKLKQENRTHQVKQVLETSVKERLSPSFFAWLAVFTRHD